MIIARSPLRISLGGGGTDIPSYYVENGGYVIAASIDKYVYVNVNRPFYKGIHLKYSQSELARNVGEVKHPIIREVLAMLDIHDPQIEISSLADIPAGTGLGSSGSFTTALIKAVYTHFQKVIHPKELAELACHIEIERLNEPIGKQDQYISAFGGISEFVFEKDGEVKANALTLSMDTIHDLEDHLLLFFTGQSRSASTILHNQVRKSLEGDLKMRKNLDEIKQIGFKTRELLTNGKTREYGSLLNDHWALKKCRGDELSNSVIDNIYEKAMKSGALGGKLIGAGGGGFLMFYASDTEKLKSAMKKIGAQEVRFRFDFEGTKIIMT